MSVNQFDGVLLDYRGLAADAGEGFAQFITELGAALSQQGSRLGVVVPAERGDEGEWRGGVYDWRRLGAAVDYLVLRARLHPQDFDADSAGNLAALLRAATSAVEGRKLLLSLSASSLRQVNGMLTETGWHTAFAPAGDVILQADAISETGAIEPGTVVRASLDGQRLRLGFDQAAQTTYLDYLDPSGESVARAWLTDAAALRHRLKQTLPFAIGGVAFFGLAGGRPRLAPDRDDNKLQVVSALRAPAQPAPRALVD